MKQSNSSIHFEKYPFIKATLFLCIGILLGYYYNIEKLYLYYITPTLAISYLIIVYKLSSSFLRNHSYIPGIILYGIFVLLGATNMVIQRDINHTKHFKKICTSADFYSAAINSQVEKTYFGAKAKAKVTACKCKGEWIKTTGNVLLRIARDSSIDVMYGDQLVIRGIPDTVHAPGNPQQFNYQMYLQSKNIYFIDNISQGNFIKQKKWKGNILVYYIIKTRKFFIKKLDYLNGSKEKAIAEAILLGNKNNIDKEIRKSYAETGTMHLLAVSGLHVGIIFYAIILLTTGSINSNQFKFKSGFIAIIVIWFYASLIGFHPPVIRASLMFSLFIIAKILKRKTNIYNIIFLTAFILLIYNPLYLWDLGFQLSFIAVISIITIYPFLEKLINSNNNLGNYIWKLICVSMAAQIGVFPLSLYYFNLFPNYFLLANVLVIPFAFPTVISGWIFLLSSIVSQQFSQIISFFFKYLLILINKIIFSIEKIPYASIQNIHIDIIDLVSIYMIIIFLSLLLIHKRVIFFYLASAAIMFFLTKNIINNEIIRKQKIFAVYQVKGHSVYGFIRGIKGDIITDSSFIEDEDKYYYFVKPHLLNKDVRNVDRYSLKNSSIETLYPSLVKGETRLIASSTGGNILFIRNGFTGTVPSDLRYLVIADNPKPIFNFQDTTQFRIGVIFDSSNYPSTERKFLEKYPFIKGNIYSVNKQGAFIAKY